MTPQMGAFGQAEVVALIAVHNALTIVHGTVDDVADQTDIANHAGLPNAHHAQVHGVADHNDVTRELFIPALTGWVQAGARGSKDYYGVAVGGANVAEPVIYFTMKVPDDFVSFTSLKAVWNCATAVANMYWTLFADYAAPGEDNDTHTDAPALGLTATLGANLINVQEPANPLTLVNLVAGDYIGIAFYRDGTDVSDTLNATCNVFGLLFTYVASQ